MTRTRLRLGVEAAAVRCGVTSLSRLAHRGRSIASTTTTFCPTMLDRQAIARCICLDLASGANWTCSSGPTISFDDAYRGAVTLGVQELANRGLPATIFVAPALLGGRSFWWDRLADAAIGHIPPDVRRLALREFRGEDAKIRIGLEPSGPNVPMDSHHRSATEEELARAVSMGHILLGSHSWSHRNLTFLDGNELADELVRPLEWLRQRFDAVIAWLSYPYGLVDRASSRAAAAAGYEAALLASGAWWPRRPKDRYMLPRVNVPSGVSLHGFALRALGLGKRSMPWLGV